MCDCSTRDESGEASSTAVILACRGVASGVERDADRSEQITSAGGALLIVVSEVTQREGAVPKFGSARESSSHAYWVTPAGPMNTAVS